MAPRLSKQLALPAPPTWGGRRVGAGRKPCRPRPNVSHTARPGHNPRHPVHITLRATRGLQSLRSQPVFEALRLAFSAAHRDDFRVVHFSVQTDHIHLIAEADSSDSLRSGINGLAGRLARALNRVLRRRGAVWGDRYHARALATPREVRNGSSTCSSISASTSAPRPASTHAAPARGSTDGRERLRHRSSPLLSRQGEPG